MNNKGELDGEVWGDKEVKKIDMVMDRWWEHSTIKKAGRKQCNGMKTKEGWDLGRGELRRVRTDRTTTTTWAKDGDGDGNNNAQLLLSELFPNAWDSMIFVSQCPSVLCSSPSATRAPLAQWWQQRGSQGGQPMDTQRS